MRYRIELVASAKGDLRRLKAADRAKALDRIARHLTSEPTAQNRSRIKALRAGTYPPFRLRVDDLRVYCDVHEPERLVVVLGIVEKAASAAWLERTIVAARPEGPEELEEGR